MSNKEKYINAFVEGLEIDADIVKEGLEYQSIPEGYHISSVFPGLRKLPAGDPFVR